MPNIQFSYLYRDAGNYKKHHSVVFSNPGDVDLSKLKALIQSKLIDGEWFYADRWQLPDLHFGTWNNEIDHTFHEFESIEYTACEITEGLNLAEFMAVIDNL